MRKNTAWRVDPDIACEHYVVFSTFSIILSTMKFIGVFPLQFVQQKGFYKMSWKSCRTAFSILNAVVLSIVATISLVGLVRYGFSNNTFKELYNTTNLSDYDTHYIKERASTHSAQILVLAFAAGCLLNASVNSVNLLQNSNGLCQLLNSWQTLAMRYGFSSSSNLRRYNLACSCMLYLYLSLLFIAGITGVSNAAYHTIDLIEEIMLMFPRSWLLQGKFFRAVSYCKI